MKKFFLDIAITMERLGTYLSIAGFETMILLNGLGEEKIQKNLTSKDPKRLGYLK